MDRNILQTSTAIRVIKSLRKAYEYLTLWVLKIYKDSQLYKKKSKLFQTIIACFKYSFLGRITDIRDGQDGAVTLSESWFVRWLLDICRIFKSKLINCLATSLIVNSTKEIRKNLHSLPIKLGSIILVTAVSINMFLSILLHREIELLWWVIWILLLFVGLGGLSCDARWEEIKKTSLLMRYKNNYCKISN